MAAMSRAHAKLTLVSRQAKPEAPSGSAASAIPGQGDNAVAAAADSSLTRDSYAATALADVIDRSVHAATARLTAGLSPIALADAYLDWASHLAFSPGKRSQLVEKAAKKVLRFGTYLARRALEKDVAPCIVPL